MPATTTVSGDSLLVSGFTITPNNSTVFPIATKQIRITGTSGDLAVTWMDGTTSVEPVLSGATYNWRLTKVSLTGTTATGIRGYI